MYKPLCLQIIVCHVCCFRTSKKVIAVPSHTFHAAAGMEIYTFYYLLYMVLASNQWMMIKNSGHLWKYTPLELVLSYKRLPSNV